MIVGVRKSGTQSFKRFLLGRGYDVECWEGRFTLPRFYETHDYTRIPIIITRDPVERAWSDYKFFKDYDPPMNPRGIDDAIEPSKYEKYSKFWNCLTFRLEDLIKESDFPHENKGKPIPMSAEIRQKITESL